MFHKLLKKLNYKLNRNIKMLQGTLESLREPRQTLKSFLTVPLEVPSSFFQNTISQFSHNSLMMDISGFIIFSHSVGFKNLLKLSENRKISLLNRALFNIRALQIFPNINSECYPNKTE